MAKYECTRCGEQYDENVDFCTSCGFPDVSECESNHSSRYKSSSTGCLIPLVIFLLISLLGAAGCSERRNPSLTPGGTKKHIKLNQSTQVEIIEVFGTPNIVTQSASGEVWVYDKISSQQTSSAFGLGGGGGGGGHGGAGGGRVGGGIGSSTRSETTVMLIIYFDRNDIVRDYKIKQTKF